jgi:general secretion pathway protein G
MGIGALFGAMAVVIAVAFAFYFYVEARAGEGKRALTIERMGEVQEALEKYLIDCGGLPTQKQGLEALVRQPERQPVPRGWRGPYLHDSAKLKDGWGRSIKYYWPGGSSAGDGGQTRPYDLASFGCDGQEGGKALDRDIRSWERATMAP